MKCTLDDMPLKVDEWIERVDQAMNRLAADAARQASRRW